MTPFVSTSSTHLGNILRPEITAPQIAWLMAENERRKGWETSAREREQHFEQANKWSAQLGMFKLIKGGLTLGR